MLINYFIMSDFPYKTFGGWVRSYGLTISDLSEEELKAAREEFEARKSGAEFLDGVLESRPIEYLPKKR